MNDRELLEAAALAAGNCATWYRGFGMGIAEDAAFPKRWDPLTDDGDALRLAVKLGIEIAPDREMGVTNTAFSDGVYGYNTCEEWGPLRDGSQDDPYAATRRAIVRAAAALSPTTPKEPT